MKKLLVISDSHGNASGLIKLEPIMKECDYVIHLGDGEGDIHIFDDLYRDKIYSVYGNCDGGGEDAVLQIEDCKVILTHGDKHGVRYSLMRLSLYGKEQLADVVLYGHTHTASIVEQDGITFINPGTMARGVKNSYCYCVINGGSVTAKIVEL